MSTLRIMHIGHPGPLDSVRDLPLRWRIRVVLRSRRLRPGLWRDLRFLRQGARAWNIRPARVAAGIHKVNRMSADDVPDVGKVVKLRQPPPPDWTADLAHRGERIIADERNVLLALRAAPDLIDLVRFNSFQNRVEFGRVPPWRKVYLSDPWEDQDDLHLQTFLQEHGLELRQRNSIAECVAAVARDWTVHPVREYLASLEWDGEPRLQIWLAEYLDAEGPPDYQAAIGSKFLVSAVARIDKPGCQVDHVLTLEGPQGVGKTETVRVLGEPWTTDGLPDLHSKDAAIHLAGIWFVEIAELAAMRRSEIEATKAFLSRRDDRYRPPYARRSVDVPRQCVFIATTNEGQYLRDPTGNRRFWPVDAARRSICKDSLATATNCGPRPFTAITRARRGIRAMQRRAWPRSSSNSGS